MEATFRATTNSHFRTNNRREKKTTIGHFRNPCHSHIFRQRNEKHNKITWIVYIFLFDDRSVRSSPPFRACSHKTRKSLFLKWIATFPRFIYWRVCVYNLRPAHKYLNCSMKLCRWCGQTPDSHRIIMSTFTFIQTISDWGSSLFGTHKKVARARAESISGSKISIHIKWENRKSCPDKRNQK